MGNPPPAPRARTHVVKKGETLFDIARKYYGSTRNWQKIQEANRTKVPDPRKLKIGIRPTIPPEVPVLDKRPTAPAPPTADRTTTGSARTYTVKPGDNFSKIAKAHYGTQTKWRLIFEANRDRIADPNILPVGTVLIIPKE